MSGTNGESNRTAYVAIASAMFVSLILVGLGYLAYINSDISQDITKPEVEDKLTELGGDNEELPPLTKPVDGKEIQDKIDELSDDLATDKDKQNKLDTNALSDKELGL